MRDLKLIEGVDYIDIKISDVKDKVSSVKVKKGSLPICGDCIICLKRRQGKEVKPDFNPDE